MPAVPGFVGGSHTLRALNADADRTINRPLCQCGCGASIVGKRGARFAPGHSTRMRPIKAGRYRQVQRKFAHRVRAEQALGKPLPPGAEVHHADGSTNVDAPLVICQDGAYHHLLHVRRRVLMAGGNPNTDRLCYTCKQVKPIAAFVKRHRNIWYCKECSNARARARRASARKEQAR